MREAGKPTLCIVNTGTSLGDDTVTGVVLDEAKELSRVFSRVVVVLFGGGRRATDLREIDGVWVREVWVPNGLRGLSRPLRIWLESPLLFVALLRLQHAMPSVVLRSADTIVAGVPVIMVSRLLGIPAYTVLAGSAKETAMLKANAAPPIASVVGGLVSLAERIVLRTSSGTLAMNRALARRATACGAKVVSITPGYVSQDMLSGPANAMPSGTSGGPVTVKFIGRLEREKGVLDLLDAADTLRSEGVTDFHLEYVGAGSESNRLESEIQRRGLEALVTLRGPVPHSLIRQVLAQTDILVLPSYTEGSPVAVLEAMLARVPVIATAVGSLQEEMRDGVDLLFVQPGNSRLLANTMERLISQPSTRARLAEEGLKTAGRIARSYVPIHRDFVNRIAGRNAGAESFSQTRDGDELEDEGTDGVG